MKFELPKIYPIADKTISGLSHGEQVRLLARGGATLIQLRDKTSAVGEFYEEVVDAVRIGQELGVRIIINDRVDIAIASKADGVHLGQDDLPPAEARRLLGDRSIIGFSTHTIEQAIAAIALPVDYIAIGPVFATSTKERPDPTVGLAGIAGVRSAIGDFPLVAIGGIGIQTAERVLAAGADSLALISELLSDPNQITARMLEIVKLTV